MARKETLAAAVYVGDWAVAQLWLSRLAPIVGALLGALAWRLISERDAVPAVQERPA